MITSIGILVFISILTYTILAIEIIPGDAESSEIRKSLRKHSLRSVITRRAMTANCTVRTKLGVVKGQKKSSRAFSKKEYYSFLGIPYAKPPIGNLRFKDPQPPESWQGILDCLEDPLVCPQNRMFKMFDGSEDCLKLNIFTPKLPNEDSPLKPVMVWLHGGGFTFGSGNTDFYSPDYLIEQDIVLVNVNYRLAAFGFLTFETSDVPGNAGLKDQSMALRWVQQNISAFGGDPKNVTLFGESSGGASCHYQMLSPLSRGLFQRVIIHSASSLNPWALTMNGKERSFQLAESLGCKTEDPVKAIEFLRSVSPEDIVKQQYKILSTKDKVCFGFPFVPTVEVPGSGKNFLTKHPRVALQEGDFAHVPLIIGLTNKEGLVILNDISHTNEHFQALNKDIGRIIPTNLGLPTENLSETAMKIKNYYSGGKDMNWETLNPYLDLIGDIHFSIGIDESVRIQLQTSNAPVYLYQFTYEGSGFCFKTMIKMKYPDHPDLPGVCHADDLTFIFPPNIPDIEPVDPESLDGKVTLYFMKMWGEFAKRGNPNGPGLGTKWEACKKNLTCYLEISAKPEMRYSRVFEDRMVFWESILNNPLKQKL